MKRLLLIALCLLAVLSLAVSSHAANKIWPATCITGGGDCLDGISGASLNPGDGAVVPIDGTSQFRFYILKNYTTDVPTESSPTYITPDSYPGNKRWVLIGTFPIVYTDLTGLSANMMSFLGGTSYANMRTLLGLAIGTDVQAYSANLTTFAGIAPSANVQSLLGAADYSGMRALLGLVIGTNVQAHSSNLTTFAGIAPSANVQTLLGSADYAAFRTSLDALKANGITTDSSGNINLPSGACVQINSVSVLCAGADGGYYVEVGNNTSYSGTSGRYRFLSLNGVPTFDSNGTARSLAYRGTLTNARWCTSDGTVINCTETTPAGTIGGATGSTDNAVLRADGSGGGTLQSSLCTIDDSGNQNCAGSISTTKGAAPDDITLRGGSTGSETKGVTRRGPATEPANTYVLQDTATEPTAGQAQRVASITDHVGVFEWYTPTTASSTDTFTNKTFDASGTGNVLKQIKYLVLTSPQYCDETGALLQTTKTDGAKFGQCKFSNSADKAGNYAVYELTVPPDIDTAVDLTARIYYRLGGADTAAHAYKLSVSSVAASASSAGSFGQEIAFNAAADASGADGDIEITPALASAAATLTDWKSNITPGQLLLIKLARDGDDETHDASTTDSYSNKVVISYGSTQ